MLKKVKNQKGFTLIELIAVIAILGILALLIIPRVANYSNDAKVSRFKGDLTAVKNAIERYNLEHDAPLTTTSTLSTVATELTTEGADGKGPYLGSIPTEWSGYTVGRITEIDPSTVLGVTSGGSPASDADGTTAISTGVTP
jgi:type II secretion system protein G